jgi:hypothetical protein
LGDAPIDRPVSRPRSIQQDWRAWLPEEKSSLFIGMFDELEVSYTILSVALDDAFTFCGQGRLVLAREQAAMFSGLFDRLAGRLRGVLRTLGEHGRHFGSSVQVAPLRVDLFRSEEAQTLVRANQLLSLVSLRRPGRFFRKLSALEELVSKLQKQVSLITAEISDGATLYLPEQWKQLEVLHHDLNTCFCETIIVLKSFFCAMPNEQLLPFQKRLLSLWPANMAVRSGRVTPVAAKIAPAGQPEPEARCPAAAPNPGSIRGAGGN